MLRRRLAVGMPSENNDNVWKANALEPPQVRVRGGANQRTGGPAETMCRRMSGPGLPGGWDGMAARGSDTETHLIVVPGRSCQTYPAPHVHIH